MEVEEAGPGLRAWLNQDPVGNAYLIHRAFVADPRGRVYVDDPDRPAAVVVAGEGRLVAGGEGEALGGLLSDVPPGEYHFSALDVDLLPVLDEAMEVEAETPAWLFELGEGDLRPTRVCGTSPVRPEHARMIAARWLGGVEAEDYVRARIVEGPSAGVYVKGELVAWDLSHLETGRVVMLGFLYVREAHRGRGYAKTVTTAMCEEVFARGKVAGCHVFEDNDVSLRLTEAMGFRRRRRQVWGRGRKG